MLNLSKFWIRFLVVFLIHITIKSFDMSFPNGPFELSWRSLWVSFLFIALGILIWYIAAWLDKRLREHIKHSEQSRKKTIIYALIHAVFAYALIQVFSLSYRYSDNYFFDSEEVWEGVHILNPELTVGITCLYLIIVGFESYARMHERLQEKQLKEVQLKKENITAQYKALKAQIEPHFLFNCLSVLSSLVYEDADHSADFILRLSKTLRYIIEKNEFNLVKLSEELEFLEAYFFLIKTRLDDGVFMENDLDESFVDKCYIPPVTLQLLIENAINHNTYNPERPLKITIQEEGDFIVVGNNLNPRVVLKESTQQGLKNISQRYKLISEKQIGVKKTDQEFVVKLPVLKKADYENINI